MRRSRCPPIREDRWAGSCGLPVPAPTASFAPTECCLFSAPSLLLFSKTARTFEAAFTPSSHFVIGVAELRQHRWATEELTTRLFHPEIEVVDRGPHVLLAVHAVEPVVEGCVLGAQGQCRRAESGQL